MFNFLYIHDYQFFQLPKRSPYPPAHSWNSIIIQTVSKDFQLLIYHFPPHLNQSLGGLPLKHWPYLIMLLFIRSDKIISSPTGNWKNEVTLQNEHTVFPIPTLLETGTISSLALLGSLANLHCKERSNTLLWNLKKNTAHEDSRTILCHLQITSGTGNNAKSRYWAREFPARWLEATEHNSTMRNW